MSLIDKLQWLAILLLGSMVFIQSFRIAFLEKLCNAISIILISEHDNEDMNNKND